MSKVVGRKSQQKEMMALLNLPKSSFLAVTGRRRVGKTFLIDQTYADNMCFTATGIQNQGMAAQIVNFTQKLLEYSKQAIATSPQNWQEVFILFKAYLGSLPKDKKQVIFLDEVPWMSTARSGFIQFLAHLWNDYLSKEEHFILVICGSATSWITAKIINDKGGFHNRISKIIRLQPFTLGESKLFLASKHIHLTESALAEIYMALGGIPFYLDLVKRGESASTNIERLCFSKDGLLNSEYENLYKALFNYPENHEAIVKALATGKQTMTREEILKSSKVEEGGPYTRAMSDLILSGFIREERPFGRRKRGATFRLVDEYSVFYHRFIRKNKNAEAGTWSLISNSQSYKIWKGYAFETLCIRHISEIKRAMGIASVYTETSSFRKVGTKTEEGFQIDIVIDRKDDTINLCECKFYSAPFTITKKYAESLRKRRELFRVASKTKKQIFTTFISNYPPVQNAYALDIVDSLVTLSDMV